MIPTTFDYLRATDLDAAIEALATAPGARALAGGHSLLPALKLRRESAGTLVDLWPLRSELAGVHRDGDELVVGALTRYVELETDPLVTERLPLLAHAAHQVGDTQVRRRGTIGGSLAFAARAGDLPGVVLALDGRIVVQGRTGRRELSIDELLVGDQQTALADDELIVEVRFPDRGCLGWSYQRFTRRTQDWPTVAVSCVRSEAGTAVALTNVAARAVRAGALEAALAAGSSPNGDLAALLGDAIDPVDDLKASAGYRRHLAAVLTRRALVAAG